MNLPPSKAEALAAGSLHYFTGKPCKRGHVDTRNIYGHCHGCIRAAAKTEERKAKARIYGKGEKRLSYIRSWREQNRERVCQYTQTWRDKNPEASAEYMRQRRDRDRPAMLAKERERYQERREFYAEKGKRYRAKNPELIAAYARNRRALKKSADGTHTRQDIADLLKAQKCRCGYCRQSVRAGYHVDHIIPLALGGSNDKRNLQILCPACNMKKQDKHPVDFARELGRLL